jgi:hypothetical protein
LSANPVVFEIITRRCRERSREVWTGVNVASCTPEEIEQARIAGYEPGTGDAAGTFVGRDPREMEPTELELMDHQRMSPMEAIRAKCLDCVGGSANEVRLCVAMACPSCRSAWAGTPGTRHQRRGANKGAGSPPNGLRKSIAPACSWSGSWSRGRPEGG